MYGDLDVLPVARSAFRLPLGDDLAEMLAGLLIGKGVAELSKAEALVDDRLQAAMFDGANKVLLVRAGADDEAIGGASALCPSRESELLAGRAALGSFSS